MVVRDIVILWISLGVLWWLGLHVGFSRAIAKRMGPIEKRLFRVYFMGTGAAVVALVPVALYTLFADGHIVAGLGAVVLTGFVVQHVRRRVDRRHRTRG